MINRKNDTPDETLDLTLERAVDLPPEALWRAWTEPELIKRWFCPKPWRVVEAEVELVPGGLFRTVMQSPEGERYPNDGCFLEVVPHERLVWTNALGPGFRPIVRNDESSDSFSFVGILTFERAAAGAIYRALARHGDAKGCQRHREMGFQEGWGIALDQLVELMKSLEGEPS